MINKDFYKLTFMSVYVMNTRLVDGPLAYSAKFAYSRYPAVPSFHKWLSQHFSIYLDDINRTGAFEIIQRWSKSLGLPYAMQFMRGDIGIIYSGNVQTV